MQGRVSLGIDTSCYTTSVACTDKRSIVFEKRTMLSVPFGNRGLRQSEGLFQHVKQLSLRAVRNRGRIAHRHGCGQRVADFA